MIRILIADDHSMLRQGIKQILVEDFPKSEFGEAANTRETLSLLAHASWDILLLDIFMPGGSGLDILHDVIRRYSQIPVLVLSSAPEEQMAVRVLRTGAAGYLNKQAAPEELVKAVKKILAGGKYVSAKITDKLVAEFTKPAHSAHEALSEREFQVLQMLAAGKLLKEIAAELSLSPKTISTFHTRILEKLKLQNDVELAHYAAENGLIERARLMRPGASAIL